ncbi:hypothetical protein TNCV_1780121 [Trichonephila clavipes]|nr:hypothetical protein TNCV_1780121 [Trichonephila clavipes]
MALPGQLVTKVTLALQDGASFRCGTFPKCMRKMQGSFVSEVPKNIRDPLQRDDRRSRRGLGLPPYTINTHLAKGGSRLSRLM